MDTRKNPTFTVVGAGLSGALMAGYLAKAGYAVRMFEKLPDPRGGDAPAGRSINLAISTRGIHALDELGIADEVLASAVPMRGRMMHAESSELTFQPYGTEKHHVINSVSRSGLNIALLNVASKYSNAELRFNQRCTGADLDAASVEITSGTNDERHMVPGDIVIGSDGAFSVDAAAEQVLDPEFHLIPVQIFVAFLPRHLSLAMVDHTVDLLPDDLGQEWISDDRVVGCIDAVGGSGLDHLTEDQLLGIHHRHL